MTKWIAGMLFFWFAIGCAPHSTIVRFDKPAEKMPPPAFPPTGPETIGVYRVTKPFEPFQELGLISFRTDFFSLPAFYDQLRKDAGEQGAEAIVDLRVTSETHTEIVWERRCTPRTVCNTNGVCTTDEDCTDVPVSRDVTTFLAAGTMIRRKR